MNRKKKTLITVILALVVILSITIIGILLGESSYVADFSRKNLPPSLRHPFGTDWMGRDMFARTIKGLSLSIMIGIGASVVSAVMAVMVGTLAGTMPAWVDHIILWMIDLVMSIPHMVLLILISFAVGRGLKGIIIGIILTHWTSLARLIRSEVKEIHQEFYIQLSRQLGKSNLYIMKKHVLPHLIPQFVVGLVLLFPHAILHEAGVTFLGFGLSPEQPAIGIILAESMKYLSSGMWWLAFFPGLALVGTVVLFDQLGDNLKKLMDPYSAQE